MKNKKIKILYCMLTVFVSIFFFGINASAETVTIPKDDKAPSSETHPYFVLYFINETGGHFSYYYSYSSKPMKVKTNNNNNIINWVKENGVDIIVNRYSTVTKKWTSSNSFVWTSDDRLSIKEANYDIVNLDSGNIFFRKPPLSVEILQPMGVVVMSIFPILMIVGVGLIGSWVLYRLLLTFFRRLSNS